jgi:hypothetical protein
MLKANFGKGWVGQEFDHGGREGNSGAVEDFIRSHPDMTVLSSHTAHLPLPRIPGLRVFPIVFLRHPIDRIRSAYDFERKQKADTFGARLAKETDFPGYVRVLLDQGSGQVHNFHIKFLVRGQDKGASELERAKATLMSLPFVGVVEDYAQSVARLERLLQPHFPGFAGSVIHLNVTGKGHQSLDAKLAEVRDELGADLDEDLAKANAADLQLYNWFRTSRLVGVPEPVG